MMEGLHTALFPQTWLFYEYESGFYSLPIKGAISDDQKRDQLLK